MSDCLTEQRTVTEAVIVSLGWCSCPGRDGHVLLEYLSSLLTRGPNMLSAEYHGQNSKLSLTCNGIRGLLRPNRFEEYTHNLINTLVTNLQLFSVTVQSNTSPHPYSLVWENSSRDGIFVLDPFCVGTSDGVSGSLLAASLCLLPILLSLHSPYWQRGKDLLLRGQELLHVISFDADKNNIQGRVNCYFRGKETESQKAFISRPSCKVTDSSHTGFPP